VGEALPQLVEEELDEKISTLDLDAIAIEHAEERGIIFVDEIDKLVRGRDGGGGGGGVSAFSKGEGVQKELLSLIEGTGVRTQRGLCSTAHVLFICAGAFHQAKPSDLLPELQGRLPVRVELKPLTEADFVRILSETRFNLLMQQTKLLETEGVVLSFTEDAVVEIARLAARVNATVENIGARRLRTVVAKLMEKVSFTAPTLQGTSLTIDAEYVKAHTGDMATKVDVGKYIL
jgi:ATP-dependent HslUV protease ATP-binding subunit HslU